MAAEKALKTESGLSLYHPIVSFVYFVAVIAGTLLFIHPVFVLLSLGSALLCAGLINGILLTALSLLFSFFFAKSADCYATGYSAAISALLHAGVVGLSIGGAFWGAREKTPTKRRKKRRR